MLAWFSVYAVVNAGADVSFMKASTRRVASATSSSTCSGVLGGGEVHEDANLEWTLS